MKDKRNGLVVIYILLMTLQPVQAQSQWGKELGNRIKQRAKRRTEQKVDQKTDQALDSLFVKRRHRKDDSESEEKETSTSGSSAGNADVNTSQEYRFEFEATIEVENYDKKKAQKNTIVQSYGEGALFSTVEGSKMIHDFNSEMVYMMDTERMTAQAISLKWFTKHMGGGADSGDDKEGTVTKTGRTEIINGYKCHEYIIDHEDGKVEAWLAPDVNFDYSDYMQGFSKMFSKKSKVPPSEKGYVMRITAFDEKSEKITHMEVIDLNDTSTSISLSDYQVIKLF